MKARIIAVAALLVLSLTAFAQGEPGFRKTYSIEIGTGIQPLYMGDYPNMAVQKRLESQGMAPVPEDCFHPVITLTGVVRTEAKTEFTLSTGVSWYLNRLMKYPVFGTDPYGQPRYNLNEGQPAGKLHSSPEFSFLFQYRHLWNPQNALVCYSGFGAGFSTATGFFPLPSLTPIALRLSGEHIYVFVEGTVSVMATFVHGGLGWRF